MGIGGRKGWYGGNWLWRVRGLLDKLIGGPGLRRGRRDQHSVVVGDALDFWRVVDVQPGKGLTLRAEMKLPGTAMLDFEIEPDGDGCRLATTARFLPRGLMGIAYWYSVLPLHVLVFRGMLHGLKQAAERREPARAASRRAASEAASNGHASQVQPPSAPTPASSRDEASATKALMASVDVPGPKMARMPAS